MSHKCPRCGLFSPVEASRCDCGYDFATKTVAPSYLMAHILKKKHSDEATLIQQSSRTYIRRGVLLLGVAAAIAIWQFLARGRVYFLAGVTLWGALWLSRGLRQRRHRSLDSDAQRDLMRRF
jgi:hypothetical protein